MDTFCKMTDEELVVSYAGGDDCAFDLLLSRHKQSLYSYIFYTVRDRGLAEDLFQDTFVKAIITIRQGRYVESGRFGAWLMRIAHNLIIDYFRRKRSENTVSNDDCETDLFNDPSLCDDTVEMEMVKSQVCSDVKKLIGFLPEVQREVLEMRYYRDLSFREIADATGVSINTALGRMRYAILNMRRMATDHKMILTVN
ncbi:MAG: sigma-70 family RNA polymerase sigma factor [Proteiniphilum sp.]|jgi:RNA polymerase sigma-70 factor (ECF subfamily)|nr:sigma-70 family RNA polymerase sigma factor [Proteiniphilum sp.]